MTAAILCPGPSVISQTADLVMGVNRAALLPCDVFCAMDWQLAKKLNVEKTWLTTKASSESLAWPFKVITDQDFDPNIKSFAWPFLSIFLAIGYAAHQGASEISVCGADWRGTKDFDGIESGHTRSESRWESEREIFERMKTELDQRGISLKRI